MDAEGGTPTPLAPERDTVTTGRMRLIGHLANPFTHEERMALCGAEILGIPAFGQFEPCAACDAEWERIFA